MLRNRLHLTIAGQVDQDEFHGLLAELHDTYTSKITGMHLVLPTRSDPSEIARCVAIGADKAVKWSGSITVVSRKRGVLIKLEVAKGEVAAEPPSGAYVEEIT
jgi:hypothetical protein